MTRASNICSTRTARSGLWEQAIVALAAWRGQPGRRMRRPTSEPCCPNRSMETGLAGCVQRDHACEVVERPARPVSSVPRPERWPDIALRMRDWENRKAPALGVTRLPRQRSASGHEQWRRRGIELDRDFAVRCRSTEAVAAPQEQRGLRHLSGITRISDASARPVHHGRSQAAQATPKCRRNSCVTCWCRSMTM